LGGKKDIWPVKTLFHQSPEVLFGTGGSEGPEGESAHPSLPKMAVKQ